MPPATRRVGEEATAARGCRVAAALTDPAPRPRAVSDQRGLANTRLRIPSPKILQDACDGAAAINATAVIVHGGHAVAGDIEAGSPVICETVDEGCRNDIAFLRELCG
jgi:hypothetical protein